jgi:predicted nucleic acid-binding Zn ribbon protein
MEEIKDVLETVVRDLMKKRKNLDFQKALDAWKKIVGPRAFQHTQIVYLTKDKIRVNVDNSAWLYELNLQKQRIQKELRAELEIEDVRFRLGEVERDAKPKIRGRGR